MKAKRKRGEGERGTGSEKTRERKTNRVGFKSETEVLLERWWGELQSFEPEPKREKEKQGRRRVEN